jgi:ATP-dependent RNA helicase RhlE
LRAGFVPTPHDSAPIDFDTLGLDERLLKGLEDRRFERTTPIQSAAIPLVLDGADLIGCAQTGTGKTAAFLVPLLNRLLGSSAPLTSTRILVLAPTRELASQIEEDFHGLAYYTDLTGAAVYGGVPSGPQERALRAPVDVVVATPGRLLDHMGCGLGRFDGLHALVLDEADRMLDMGFWPSVRRIIESLPAERQTLFFSATMSNEVFQCASQIMRAPKLIQIGETGGLASGVTHHARRVPAAEKTAWLAGFLRQTPDPALVFVRTKRGAERLARRLADAGVRCVALHGDRTQSQRTAAMEGFRARRYAALIATDIAARGLDIEGIEHVINFEVPDCADTYVHRAGRTGRAEASGIALTLTADDELDALGALERSLNIRFARSEDATSPRRSPRPRLGAEC